MKVSIPKHELAQFCKNNKIYKLSLFGSAVRGELNPDSDIDFLVEFKQGYAPSFFELYRLETELTEIFNGRKIDLRTPADLSKYFRDEVVSGSEVLYSET
jgi:predicted nucleotidyltransferase